MSLLRSFARDRRVWLIVLLAALAWVLSRHALGSEAAVRFVVKSGYWVLLFVFGYFAYAVSRCYRAEWAKWRAWRNEWRVVAFLVACASVLLAHEKYGFKILADEVLLTGTSMGMHYEREASYPVRATDVQGPFQVIQSVLDKRPFFFPFLVALAHDVTGYRPENAFYVNTVLGFVFLALLFALGTRIGRSRWAGALLVLLFTGLPLLAQQMKGGGFELLNLVMLSAVLWFAIRWAERRDEDSLAAFCYAALLLAYTRYESILLLVPVAGLVLWGWWREQRVVANWAVVIAPAFLLVPLLQNRVFTLNAGAWELASRPGATAPFGFQYVASNLGHAAGFFFDTTGYQPNSPHFAALGVLAAAFFLLWIVRVFRTLPTASPADIATAFVGTGLFGIWALLMLYFWGEFDHPVIHRLSLPVHLLMGIGLVAAIASLRNVGGRAWQVLCIVAIAGLVVYSLPVMSRRAYGVTYSPAVEMEWRTEFLRRFPQRDYLFIDNDSTFWISHKVPATPATQAKERVEGLTYHLKNNTFSAMYVMQHFRIDPETGARVMEPTDEIGPDFELEPFWERRIQTLFIGRISRVVAIRQGGEVAAKAGPVITPPGADKPLPRTTDEWNAAKKAYVDKWLKDLP